MKKNFFPYDWEEIQLENEYDRVFKALGPANIRPFGDITNTAYGRLCLDYNEYHRQLRLRKKGRRNNANRRLDKGRG